jgi:diacylglycerol kinase (ATP)
MSRHALVVVNPASGRADVAPLRRMLAQRLAEHGWEHDIYAITGADDVAAVVRAACARGVDLVVAAGGDGTVASVVNGMWQSNACLGILPLGTGNMLARAMAIPTTLAGALDLIVGPHALQLLDLMRVGEHVYVINVSAGLSARGMRDTPTAQKRRFGMLAYMWTMGRDLLRRAPQRFNLTIDGQQLQVRASEILVSNGAWLREPPFPYGPPSGFNDQQFDVYILTARRVADYLQIIRAVLHGSWKRQTALHTLTMRESITIDAAGQRQPVQADGEWIGHTPVTVRLIPGALRVIVPQQAENAP